MWGLKTTYPLKKAKGGSGKSRFLPLFNLNNVYLFIF